MMKRTGKRFLMIIAITTMLGGVVPLGGGRLPPVESPTSIF